MAGWVSIEIKQEKLKVLDLFSGIGGFSLGLERTGGFRTVAFCEIEAFPRKVLRKHWPDVPIFEDVRRLHATDLPAAIDIVCGGFPCQPASVAGKRRGSADDRWLWPEAHRLIYEISPAWVLLENVPGLLTVGNGLEFEQVCSDLESEGYEVQPFVIPACAVNAPHRRDRVWIIAYAAFFNCDARRTKPEEQQREAGLANGCNVVTDPDTKHGDFSGLRTGQISQQQEAEVSRHFTVNPESQQTGRVFKPWFSPHPESGGDWRGKIEEWTTQPGVCERDDGVSGRMARSGRVAKLKALGNAVVPQIPELLGLAILASSVNG